MNRTKMFHGLAYLLGAIGGGWGIPILASWYTSTQTVGIDWLIMTGFGVLVGLIAIHVIFTPND